MKNISISLSTFCLFISIYLSGQNDCSTFCSSFNTYIGFESGNSNLGNSNSFVGFRSGYHNEGSSNSFFGTVAGFENTSGSSNSFFGNGSGNENTTGSSNSFFGSQSGETNNIGSSNSFFGSSAGFGNWNGNSNSIFGDQAGYSNINGNNNSFFGTLAGYYTIGSNNSLFGRRAGYFITSGSHNICLGYNSGPTSMNESQDSCLYIDVQLTNDPLIYGQFSKDLVKINGNLEVTAGLNNPSSREYKAGFEPVDEQKVLESIQSLIINRWYYKDRPEELHIGPIAEDFYAAFGLNNSEKNISTIDANGVALVAIKALAQENSDLKKQNEEQQLQLDQLIKEVEALKELVLENR